MEIQIYTQEFLKARESVFVANNAFRAAQDELLVLDGIAESDVAFTVKTTTSPITLNDVGTDGCATGSPTLVKFVNESVPYAYTKMAEAQIRYTNVNKDFDDAVAVTQIRMAKELTKFQNKELGKFISAKAGVTKTLAAAATADQILALFATIRTEYTNAGITVPITAYVGSNIYNKLLLHLGVMNISNTSINLDLGGIPNLVGFRVAQAQDQNLVAGDLAYFVPDGFIVPFVGIVSNRILDNVPRCPGVVVEYLEKGGWFIPESEDNAIVKIVTA